MKVTQLCLTHCDPGQSTGIPRLEWVVFPFSRGSSQHRDLTPVSHIKRLLNRILGPMPSEECVRVYVCINCTDLLPSNLVTGIKESKACLINIKKSACLLQKWYWWIMSLSGKIIIDLNFYLYLFVFPYYWFEFLSLFICISWVFLSKHVSWIIEN